MRSASISYVKAHLSAILERVRRGQAVIITDRGAPVARLEPIATVEWDERLRSLVERGLATPPRITPAPAMLDELPAAPVLARGASIVRAVLVEREEGW
jgi:prevent-host-death family protein